MLIDGKNEGRDDRPADDTEPIDLSWLKVQIEPFAGRTPGTGTGNGCFILLVVQTQKTSSGGRIGTREPTGVGCTELVFELPRRAPVFISQKDDPLLIVLEGEGPWLILNDKRAMQPIQTHGVKVSVPESRSRRVGNEIVFHLFLSRNGALVLGGEPVRVRGSALMNPVPMNLGGKLI